MFFCPLCTTEVHRQGFGSLDSLKAHLDLFHCSVTGSSVRHESTLLAQLESRIEKLVESQLPKPDERPAMQAVSTRRSAAGSGLGGGLLQKYAHEFDLASAENDYLKRKFREDARKWRLELDEEKEKYEQLESQFTNLVQVLDNACKNQRDGKKQLQVYVDKLIGDVDRLENQLQEANAMLEQPRDAYSPFGQMPHPRFAPSIRSDITDTTTESRSRRNRVPTSRSLDAVSRPSTLRHSDMATDSGIDDHSEVGRTQRRAVSRSGQDSRLRVQREDQAAAYSSYDRAYEEPAFATYFDGKDTAEDEPNVLKSSAQLDPYDMVLALVFQRLEALDLLQCALVSRKWRTMARNPLVWRSAQLKNRAITNEILISLSRWCSQTAKLTLANVRLTTRPGGHDKINGSLERGLEEILRSSNGCLQFLKVVACAPFITDRALWLAACHCKNLQKVMYISDLFPANAPSLWALGAACRMLDTLLVPPSQSSQDGVNRSLQFDDEALLMIARCFPTTLRVLCIGGPKVTVTGLKYIAKSCQWLEALELDHCTDVTLRAARTLCAAGLKSIQVLNFTHCNVSVSALKYFCDRLPQIRSVRVIFSWRDFPSAKHVESFLSECQSLMDSDPAAKRILRLEERI